MVAAVVEVVETLEGVAEGAATLVAAVAAAGETLVAAVAAGAVVAPLVETWPYVSGTQTFSGQLCREQHGYLCVCQLTGTLFVALHVQPRMMLCAHTD